MSEETTDGSSQRVFKPVDPGFKFTGTSKEYVPAPVNQLLPFHVMPLEFTEQIDNFKTNPKGEPNPDFGKPKPVLIFKAMLDATDAKGQIYSRWINGYYDKDGNPQFSTADRSTLGPIAEAIAGSVAEFQKLTAEELVGMPFMCSLKPGKKDPTRLILNTDKIMPPMPDQVKVKVEMPDTLPTDEDLENDLLDTVAQVFEGAEEAK